MATISVYAPASIGNVSVGFDVLGAAVSPCNGSLLGDKVTISDSNTEFSLECQGDFVAKLPEKQEENLVYFCWQAFKREVECKGKRMKPLHMILEKNMPIGSGLGSSACSVVAALDALNRFHGAPLTETELLKLMGQMEGQVSGSMHYDNVAPAYLGGLQFMVQELDIISQQVPSFDEWYWVMAYPGIKVPTAEARAILPSQYRRKDIIAHGRHLAGFIHACYSGQAKLASTMIKDVIAEPYRQQLLPNFAKTREYVMDAGALAFGISGSGPTTMTICDNLQVAERIAKWLGNNYVQNNEGFVHICKLDKDGSREI